MMHRLTSALVVDADPRGLEALAYGFEGEGWQPTLSPDYAHAPETAARSDPKLAVFVIREPIGPALEALRALRQTQPQQGPPVLVLGPESVRAEVRAIGGADFLALPAFVRDVITACKLLAATYASSGRTGDELELTASLSDYGLFYLVRTMISLGRSGILQIERANRRGEIRFSDGEVTGATVGSLQGTPALHQLLLWEEAALDLKLRSSVHRGPFNQRPDDLLDEAERFLRDFNHASKEVGPLDRVLLADEEKAAAVGETLPVEVAPLVRLFDGRRTLGDVIEDSPFRVFDTLRTVTRLLELGVLRRHEGAENAVRPASPRTIKIFPEPLQGSVVPGSDETPPPEAPADLPTGRAAVLPKEQRIGPANRRKLERSRGTLEQGTLNRTPSQEPAPSTASTADTAGPTSGELPPRASGSIQTSGTLGSARGELRATGRDVPKQVESPSVVVDMGSTAPVAAPAAASPSGPTMLAVCVMQGRAPEKKVPTPAAGLSIEVDPALLAELAAHEAAPTTPAPVTIPEPAAKPAAPVAAKPGNSRPTPAAVPATEPAPVPGSRRPSSEFNALESDFFAREADLYKQEHADSFDDLDHKQGRGPGRPR